MTTGTQPLGGTPSAMAAVLLMTVEPTDRALAGWGVFGTRGSVNWDEYMAMPGQRVLDVVSGYVWS